MVDQTRCDHNDVQALQEVAHELKALVLAKQHKLEALEETFRAEMERKSAVIAGLQKKVDEQNESLEALHAVKDAQLLKGLLQVEKLEKQIISLEDELKMNAAEMAKKDIESKKEIEFLATELKSTTVSTAGSAPSSDDETDSAASPRVEEPDTTSKGVAGKGKGSPGSGKGKGKGAKGAPAVPSTPAPAAPVPPAPAGGKGSKGKGKGKKGVAKKLRKSKIALGECENKMKSFFIEPMHLPVDEKTETIWDEIDQEQPTVPELEIVRCKQLFVDLSKAKKEAKGPMNQEAGESRVDTHKEPAGEQEVPTSAPSFLNAKNKQNCGIMQKRLPKMEQLRQCLQTMSGLSQDHARMIQEHLFQKTKSTSPGGEAEPSVFEKVEALGLVQTAAQNCATPIERFVVSLLQIPQFRARFVAMEVCLSVDESLAEVAHDVAVVGDAATMLRTSPVLRDMLRTTLNMSNIVNAGSQRGQADGFSLEVLPRLKSTKTTRQGLEEAPTVAIRDVCDYVVYSTGTTDVQRIFTVGGLRDVVVLAARYNKKELDRNIEGLREKIQGALQGLRTLPTAADSQDIVSEKISFLEEKLRELRNVESSFEASMQAFDLLRSFLNDGGNRRELTTFFGFARDFFTDVKESLDHLKKKPRK